jgi:hypothetical protein
MNIRFLVLMLCVFFLNSYTSYGKIVSKDALLSVLPRFSHSKGMNMEGVFAIEPHMMENKTVYYIVNFNPEGWMLVSGDDAAVPVIAYSHTGHFVAQNQPESMQTWMSNYARQIFDLTLKADLPIHSYWGEQPSKIIGASKEDIIEPMIKVMFNQSNPWNKFCPSDNNGRAVVGCVAVAMAQAMTVPKCPVRPEGFFSYYCAPYGNLAIDYSAEPAYNWNLIISGTDSKDAAAKLLYHCGVSVEMGYSATGSGTQTNKITGALKKYYAYPNSVKTYSRDSYTENWEDLIKNELKHGRAVVYAGNDGTSNPGHAFNLDGFDGNNMYHINWGWGGANNGYYSINNVKDGQYDYTKGQQVIVGIRAPTVAPSDINISNLTVGANKPAGTIVGSVTVDSEATNPAYQYELKGAYSIFLHDYLPSAFYIEGGYLKTLRQFDLEDEQIPLNIKVTNVGNGLSYEKDFSIRIVEGETGLDDSYDFHKQLMYVSAENKIILDCNCQNLKFNIYSLTGTKYSTGTINSGENKIDVSKLQSGYYLFMVDNPTIKPIKILIN